MAQETDEDVAEIVHVYPVFGREHEISVDCWCGPYLDYIDSVNGGEMYVHNVEH